MSVRRKSVAQGLLALSPIVVFLVLYLVVSLVLNDFYSMPLTVALLVASGWSFFTLRHRGIAEAIETFSREAGSSNVMYMVWIFIMAGAFAAMAKEVGAVEATVNLTLRYLPPQLVAPGLFVAACFISLAIGTSVGTVVALTPLAVELAEASGAQVPFMVAVVLGGAFFGDNLSFISDTTIAATRTQGCRMNEKFKANFRIVMPAATLTLVLYFLLGRMTSEVNVAGTASPWFVLPYLIVIVTALMGMNVILVLALGMASTVVLALLNGFDIFVLAGFAGDGIDSVGQLIIVTLLAAGMLGVIKAAGGIDFLLRVLSRGIHGVRGAKTCIALLVALVNMVTANNTVAILTVGRLSRDVSERYGVAPRQTASILDTSSCIVQSLIPYGAQTLLATSLAGISPLAPWEFMYYPWLLALAVAASIIIRKS